MVGISARPVILECVQSAAEFCRTLSRSHPVALFFSTDLESLAKKELVQLRERDCRLIAVVNVEQPDMLVSAGHTDSWDYGTHVQALVAMPEVAAVVLRSKSNVAGTIGGDVDTYTVGRFLPPERFLKNTDLFVAVQRDYMLLMFALRPSYVAFSAGNVMFNASLYMMLNVWGFHFTHLLTDTLEREMTKEESKVNEIGARVSKASSAPQVKHYKFVRVPFKNTAYLWIGGMEYNSDCERTYIAQKNTNHCPQCLDYCFCTVNKEIWRHCIKIMYMTTNGRLYNIFNGLGHPFFVTEDGKSRRSYTLPLWFTPVFTLCHKKPVCLTSVSNDGKSVYRKFFLYTLASAIGLRFQVILSADMPWE